MGTARRALIQLNGTRPALLCARSAMAVTEGGGRRENEHAQGAPGLVLGSAPKLVRVPARGGGEGRIPAGAESLKSLVRLEIFFSARHLKRAVRR